MRECAALKAQLDAVLSQEDAPHITLEASQVTQVSTSALQLLLAFARLLEKHSRSLALDQASDSLIAAIEQLGLNEAFASYRS